MATLLLASLVVMPGTADRSCQLTDLVKSALTSQIPSQVLDTVFITDGGG